MKVGIVTHYYNSHNYGGNLQAYALCKIINKNGYSAEQISCKVELRHVTKLDRRFTKLDKIKDINFLRGALRSRTIEKFNEKVRYKKKYENISIRNKAVLKFNKDKIPHSNEVYDEDNICKTLNKYDCFITGSDIVWYPIHCSPIYMLKFVDDNVPKFSYAASLAVDSLSEEELKAYKKYLKNYQGISVREQNAVDLLKGVSPVNVECVLDPTLLLNKEDWDEICSARLVENKYLFCYFLGDNPNARNVAKEYANKNNLKLVTIPYTTNTYRKCDDGFGDEQLYNVSPSDFISLIKYADCIFTDSFHCCVFSYIYNKNVFALRRSKQERLGARIKNFLELVNTSSHYCNNEEKEIVEYIESLEPSQNLYDDSKVELFKDNSKAFLLQNLKKAQEQIQ